MNSKNSFFKNQVILDANFILLPFQFKIHYLEDIDSRMEGGTIFIIFKQIIDELEAKKEREPKAAKFYKGFQSGISYLEKSKHKYQLVFKDSVKKDGETTDGFLLRKALEFKEGGLNIFIASNDKEVRGKARNAQIGVIFLRQKKYLSIERS